MRAKLMSGVLLLFALLLISCVSEKRTSYELAYLVEGDSLIYVEKDLLVFESDSIKLMIEDKPQQVRGDILEVYRSVITRSHEDGLESVGLIRYRRLNNENKLVAEIYVTDNENDGNFESLSVKGDVSLISKELSEEFKRGIEIINNALQRDITTIQRKGKKKTIDMNSGEEIKDESG